jgi:REP element-mobilizing transposase RayT
MTYNPDIHHRRSIRLKGYDYSQEGWYFVTICVHNREWLFGDIINGKIILNDAGKMVETEWLNLKTRFLNIELGEFVVMPNHFHGILEITATTNGATTRVAPTDEYDNAVVGATLVVAQYETVAQYEINRKKTIGNIIDAYKSITTVQYIRGVKTLDWQPFNQKLWQRNYYEHIIRDSQSHQKISDYIDNNPMNWENDELYQQEK